MARRKAEPSLFEDLAPPSGPFGLERELGDQGFRLVAGVDEAGRGPLAGPVTAAAVVLDDRLVYPEIDDSKKIKPDQRERAFRFILTRARAVGLGLVGPERIDEINILAAALEAMAQAVNALTPRPDYLLIDGTFTLPLSLPQKALAGGDGVSMSIGAASIVAKVVRDRLMVAYDRTWPGYGFASHKGYGTRAHLDALARLGPCPIHRRSFRPVRELSS